MTYDEATDNATMITVDEAIAEITAHDNNEGEDFDVAVVCGRHVLRDLDLDETIAAIDDDGNVHSADVMGWLGY